MKTDKVKRPIRRSNNFLYDPSSPLDLMVPPEPWQFEDPILTVKINEKAKTTEEPPKVIIAKPQPKGRSIAEFLDGLGKNKEVDDVKFFDLPMEKQIKTVAEEYNSGTAIKDIEDKLGISRQAIYNRLDKAKAMGLVTELRNSKFGTAKEDNPKQATPEVEDKLMPKVDIELFGAVLDNATMERAKLEEKFEKLDREVGRLVQANQIAQALHEFTGGDCADILTLFYEAVNG